MPKDGVLPCFKQGLLPWCSLSTYHGTPGGIRTPGPLLRSGGNTLLIGGSKTWGTPDTAEFHRCHTACYVRLCSANFHRFLWLQLASN